MEFTKDAVELMKTLGIEQKDFEEHYFSSNISAGSTAIFQYLGEKKRWNNECRFADEKRKEMRIVLSDQSKLVAGKIENFNEEEFKIWFANALTISYEEVLQYFLKREVSLKNKIVGA